jgi:hypothetical protein
MSDDSNKNTGYGGNATSVTLDPIVAVPAIEFDLALARALADFSRSAYTLSAPDLVVCDPATDTHASVISHADFEVIAFRGTANIRNWLTDLDFDKVPVANGIRVHHGFQKSTDAILPLIWRRLGHPADCKPLIITGHSLGGALAVLAAYELQQAGYTINSVYTFASPRVGNPGWRDVYNRMLGFKTFRVAAVGDLVPLVPGIFTTFRDGFRHVGTEVLIDGPRMWLAPNHYFELARDGISAWLAIRRCDWDFILKRHSITADYIASLNRIMAGSGFDACLAAVDKSGSTDGAHGVTRPTNTTNL